MAESDLVYIGTSKCFFVGFLVPPAEEASDLTLMETNHSVARFPLQAYDYIAALSTATTYDEFLNIIIGAGGTQEDMRQFLKSRRIISVPEKLTLAEFKEIFSGIAIVSLTGNYAENVNDLEVDYLFPNVPTSRLTVSRLVYEFLKVSDGDLDIAQTAFEAAQGNDDVVAEVIAQLLLSLPALISRRLVALLHTK